MIDTLSLKTSIYDLATSGQLSTGYTSTDAVDEILKNIPSPSAKRKRLLTKDYQYGQKHAIPSSWRWVRLGEISSYGDTPKKTDANKCPKDTWLLELEDIEAGGKLLHKTRISERQSKGEKTTFTKGQILYSKLRPYLKKVLIADEDGISTPELISFDVFGGIDVRYIVFCLLNTFTNKAIDARSYGIKMPRVDAGFMVNLPIPLPPISEQKYIANKVGSVLSEIDSLDSAQTRYTSDVAALKSKVIDAGIQGKLTEQLPEDGTAQKLFEQIQKEKAKLIKEGKIKKQKPLPAIKSEEIPFEIPENWMWVRLGEVGNWSAGATPSRSNSDYYNGNIPWIKTGELNDDYINDSDEYISAVALQECSVRLNPVGSVLIAMYGATIGKTGILGIEATTNQACCACIPFLIDNKYLLYFLIGNKPRFLDKSHGGAQPNISKDIIVNSLFPLPPLAEQRRIAERIEEILEAAGK